MPRSCLTAFDSREADDPSTMAPGFYAFPFEDYSRDPVGPHASYAEAVAAARAVERSAEVLASLAASRMSAWAFGTISTETAIAVEHAHDMTGGRVDALPVSRIAQRRFRGIVFC